MKRIIVTGANGQLGKALRHEFEQLADFEVLYTDADTLDITDSAAIKASFDSFKPYIVINAAAYTAVDKAESEPELCARINADAPGLLAQECANVGAKLIHVSTDYVFSGTANRPYKETDATSPRSIYGCTKLAGEERVKHFLPNDHVILRTAWLYSHTGKNFVKTMLTLASSCDEIGVVADQWGTPTYAPVLAQAILAVIKSKRWYSGIYHLTGSGRTTWFDFAKAIFLNLGNDKVRVNPLTTSQYPTAASRPPYSVLDCSKFTKTFGFEIPDWQTSLHQYFQDLY